MYEIASAPELLAGNLVLSTSGEYLEGFKELN